MALTLTYYLTLVIYYCETSYLNAWWPESTFTISESLCGLEIQESLAGGEGSGSGSLTGCSQDVGQSPSHLKASQGKSLLLSSFTSSVAGFSSLRVVGWKASVSHWLVAGSCPQFFTTWGLCSLLHCNEHTRRAKERTSNRKVVVVTQSNRRHGILSREPYSVC